MQPAELSDADRRSALIVLNDLHKRHGDTVALRGLSLTVPQGAIFALLGPNGCGKTTTLKLLLGMSRADSGTGTVFGLRIDHERDSVAIRRRTGFVSETKELFQQVDVATTIRLVRSFYPRWDAALEQRLLREFLLLPAQKVSALSKGMRAKLALLVACCRGADLLVLDEPTDGLDPAAAEQMLETLVSMVAETGLTVLLSSHQLHEVERVADGVAIMHDGRVLLRGELDELRMRVRRIDVHAHSADTSNARMQDSSHAPVIPDGSEVLHSAELRDGNSLLVRGDADAIAKQFADHGAEVSVHAVPLRELFLTLTNTR
ncbi:MAG: ABC transporter ATP-binding protein [Gemmatimonadaceae bacterium]